MLTGALTVSGTCAVAEPGAQRETVVCVCLWDQSVLAVDLLIYIDLSYIDIIILKDLSKLMMKEQ